MISPNFDNVSNCKLYNQDTGKLVAVGKLTDITPVLEKAMEEDTIIKSIMTFEESFFTTFTMPRGFAKSISSMNVLMEELALAKEYYRHNSFDILKALEESGYGSGGRVDFFQRLLISELQMRKKYPRGKRKVHRRKYSYARKWRIGRE